MRANKGRKMLRKASLTQLLPETSAGRETQEPSAGEPLCAEKFSPNSLSCTGLSPHRDTGLTQQLVYFIPKGPFESLTQGGANYSRLQLVHSKVRAKDGHRLLLIKEQQKPRLTPTGQLQQCRGGCTYQPLNFAIRNL